MTGKTILVVDDEKEIVTLIKEFLKVEGYKVLVAGSADEAFSKIEKTKPDLIILDLKLPGLDGREVAKILKSKDDTAAIPIVMLTGKFIKPEERAAGFELGADDYMTKPFYGKELVLRVKAILSRIDYGKEADEKLLACDGNLIIDLSRHVVKIRVKPGADQWQAVVLTPKEFDILYLLVKKRNRVLNRDFILKSVWGYEYFGTTRTVDMHIANIRQKLANFGDKIETVGGVGYKFTEE